MEEKKSKNASNKKTLIIVAIVLITLAAVLLLVMPGVLSEQNYNKGINAINSGDYEEAIQFLEKSNAEGADVLIESVRHHQAAIEAYKKDEYVKAFKEAELVDKSYPLYEEVMELYDKSFTRLISENLEAAKDYFDDKEYVEAYESLKTVLKYDPSNEEAMQLKELYSLKAYEMEAQIEKGGYFVSDSNSIRQREMVNINTWNEAGYTGKGLTVLHDDTGDTMHSLNCAAILQTILPDARILRGSISGISDKNGVADAYVNCYTTNETRVPFDEFIQKYDVSLINNSTADGDGNTESRWAVYMREKIKEYNLVCLGAAGNEGKMTNNFYGAFIMVSGVYLKADGTISGYRTSEDADFSMFMGYQSGTSYASPFLCGIAGLLRSKYPDITQEQVYEYFKNNCMDLGTSGKNPEYGWGLPILGDPAE